ncbi:MAG: hypothetical protein PVJ05_05010, partial [Candidatus Thorarchaeota archaeon]
MTKCYIDSPNSGHNHIIERSSILGYDEAPPIQISNNSDFANQASANSWDGNGSVSDPYIIEGLNITVLG